MVEHASTWFDLSDPSPYMLRTVQVHKTQRVNLPAEEPHGFAERLSLPRSGIPACTHVDQSARVQTVDNLSNPSFYQLLDSFYQRSGCPVLLNTSFNRAGEPIVRSPADALLCFVAAGIDILALEGCLISLDDAKMVVG